MKLSQMLSLAACAALLAGCAATIPQELSSARLTYQRINTPETAELAPVQLQKAKEALAVAENSFMLHPRSETTRNLAYVAQRKAEIAAATVSLDDERERTAQAQADLARTQGELVRETQQDLDKSQVELAAAERKGELAENKLDSAQLARAAAELRAATAMAELAKLAAVKNEPRGMVITISGSVLFASNQSVLLPSARERLDQVAKALLAEDGRNLIIEGHTDSQGTNSHNLTLSQARADQIRDFLVGKGYQASRIQSNGIGEVRPVADNANAEGRANNRRVEIIIEQSQRTSTQ
ncbi:MAG: OmpA family protein [Candidatus Delongbacteria bacterium]